MWRVSSASSNQFIITISSFFEIYLFIYFFFIRFDNLVHHAYLSLFTFYGTSLTREFTNSPRRFLRFHVKDYVNIQIKKYTK